jgi:hypothetical protein
MKYKHTSTQAYRFGRLDVIVDVGGGSQLPKVGEVRDPHANSAHHHTAHTELSAPCVSM